MKKSTDEITKKTALEKDIEVFEEWESGEPPKGPSEKDVPGDLDFPDFQEEPKFSAPEKDVDADIEAAPPEAFVEPDEPEEPAISTLARELMELTPDVPVNLVAVIGKISTNVGDVMKYNVGSVIDLKRPPNETVDVIVNGRMVARGELVEVDGKLGVKILKLVR